MRRMENLDPFRWSHESISRNISSVIIVNIYNEYINNNNKYNKRGTELIMNIDQLGTIFSAVT